MDCEISNAVMIDSLDTIIQQENWKLEMDKNTGLLAKIQSKMPNIEPLKENDNKVTTNISTFKNLGSHSPKLNHSCGREDKIERLANLFTHSPGFMTNNNNNRIDIKHNQVLLKENTASDTYNDFGNYKHSLQNESKKLPGSPDIKVRRNVRFGEYSPLNPANQVNSQSILGIGEYDEKKKKILGLQRQEYVEYLSKAKQEKNISDLPKLANFSCEKAFKTAMEANNNSKQNKLDGKTSMINQKDKIQPVSYVDSIETCTLDEEKIKETNRLKQELYRLELSKQIEEKKRLDQERKLKEQKEDEAIERAAREQEDKLRKEFEKESEKRAFAQLQIQLAQEKLKHELMKKQRELATAERISRQVLKKVPSRHASIEENDNDEYICGPPENTFDNVPLPTSRTRVPRKIDYKDVSCNTDTFNNQCSNQNLLSPVVRHPMERVAHVSFATDPPIRRNEYNPAALLPSTKTMIIDSPLTLALAGLDENDETCEAIEQTETAYRNQTSQEVLLEERKELPTDKFLLSNLGNIRKQLNIEHQRLKEKVRRSQ